MLRASDFLSSSRRTVSFVESLLARCEKKLDLDNPIFRVSCALDRAMVQLESVQLLRSRFIQPAAAASDIDPPTRYELTPFDGMMRIALYQKRILFFERGDSRMDFAALVTALEESLRWVLVSFRPLCGRMVVDQDLSSGLWIDCSGETSVRFAEAQTAARLEDLGGFEPSEFCDSLVEIGCSPKYPWDPKLPLLFVQVTRFGCGGISLGIAFSHQTMDGVSAWNFMKSWAERARSGGTSPLPRVSCYAYKSPMLSERQLEEAARMGGFALGMATKNTIKPKLGVKKFKATREAIRALKTSLPSFSTFELVCADYWRRMVASAVEAGILNADECYFVILVNCRGRIASMPDSYFGNAITGTRVRANVCELLGGGGICNAARAIHEGIAGLRDVEGSVLVINKFVEELARNGAEIPPHKPGQSVLVVSSPRHPIFECDFGFGRPVGVTFGTNDLNDSKLYLFPAADGNGMDVTVCMRVEALDKFV
ncbi:rosmarinate synthase [Selaginella moellendorffii]|uniref:rosmarinate synthase n=1 Tax=Selaginella moellendorffii TaxID=88036 RepID=UPI000D1C9B07|nr:rosmarinate synthase [Selaginella moellendorffii]|eukprot:XP_024532968.1 rosmarinate synthase [Selaginella moellendorffii]